MANTTKTIKILPFVLLLLIIANACHQNPVPKPYGHFRIDVPENEYMLCDTILPFSFDIQKQAVLSLNPNGKYWMDIHYPHLNATIHCSYKNLQNNVEEISEDARRLVMKHRVMADDISESYFSNPEHKVYGVFYNLSGNVASVAQFTLTDSVRHFLLGAVYFNNVPNKDSIAPVSEYIKRDVIHLMESFRWK
jgi:gliding motility-associated lipoprotein GldD